MGRGRLLLLMTVLAASGCEWVKVPVTDVNARFTVADATWFEEEQTLFVFYRAQADQGLGGETQIELAFRTDDVDQPFTPIDDFERVHTHLPVDCGANGRCGSTSIHVAKLPRDVRLQLRYHKDGEMVLTAPLTYNVVRTGPPQTNRSLIVYGVFDETNTHVQWRARHQFPTIRNEDAQALGLRRHFEILDPTHGTMPAVVDGNPYGYGYAASCGFTPLGWAALETSDRAIFDPNDLPVAAYPSTVLCARSRVTDALGTFEAVALARKNPQTAPAFPVLKSPIQTDRMVKFFLRMCGKDISEPHRKMQVQRLQLESATEICVDNWGDPGFADQLASQFRAAIDAERVNGEDMLLMFSLHHDDRTGGLALVVEDALTQILPFEQNKSSPRVSGAFVFDSYSHKIQVEDLKRLVLWCPAVFVKTPTNPDDITLIPDASARSCPLLPDNPDIVLGPLKASTLPILTTRDQYITFINKYSEAQAGKTKALTFKSPIRTPLSVNIPVGEFGVATFFNNEVLTAAPTDAFSYCAPADTSAAPIVFRSSLAPDPIPISALPGLHALAPQTTYPLGLVWDFPYLMRLEYEVVLAGAATAFSYTVPFGIATTDKAYYGTQLWEQGEFPLADALLQCTRFCDHPTFDSAGVYNISSPFTETYREQCYRPKYPAPGEGGFPIDP